MNTLIGLLIIAVGSFGQSSSYVPINKVKGWSWENFWLVQGIFAWLVFPLLGALLAIPADGSLIELWGAGGALPAMIYGVLWGVGGLTFGLSMRYLGVALGQRSDAPYWCLHHFGGNCHYRLCGQPTLQKYE